MKPFSTYPEALCNDTWTHSQHMEETVKGTNQLK